MAEDLPLEGNFTFWCMKRGGLTKTNAATDYEKSIKRIGDFHTVNEFWNLYSFLNRLTKLEFTVDCHLFRKGIKPLWEDASNKNGGKLTFRVKKNGIACMRFWESLILGFIGETLDPLLDEVCGVIASIRANEVVLSVWNKTAGDSDAVAEIKERMRDLLGLPGFVKIDYKRHMNPASSGYKLSK